MTLTTKKLTLAPLGRARPEHSHTVHSTYMKAKNMGRRLNPNGYEKAGDSLSFSPDLIPGSL